MSPMSFFSEAMESLTEESSEREFVAQIFLSDFKISSSENLFLLWASTKHNKSSLFIYLL